MYLKIENRLINIEKIDDYWLKPYEERDFDGNLIRSEDKYTLWMSDLKKTFHVSIAFPDYQSAKAAFDSIVVVFEKLDIKDAIGVYTATID